MRTFLLLLILIQAQCLQVDSAELSVPLEDFEPGRASLVWSFSEGAEFPGARGSFGVEKIAAHGGDVGGRLAFDFSGGGRYVAAICSMPQNAPLTNAKLNALQLRLKRPEGHEVKLRYTDARGQTFQRPVDCPAERWVSVTVPFSEWTGHWGGPDDGVVQGPPRSLALLIDQGLMETGSLLFDDLWLVNHDSTLARIIYPAYKFAPAEGWRQRSDGPPASSVLNKQNWRVDFSGGAKSISITPPDRVLLGNVDRLRLRFVHSALEPASDLSAAPDISVAVTLRSHFMTFHKVIGTISSKPEQELVTDGPPGPGWSWYGGENDGKIHGPLRLGEIRLTPIGKPASRTLELRELNVESSCPADKRCLLVADCTISPGATRFRATMRALADEPLQGRLHWILRDWEERELGRNSEPVKVPAKGAPIELVVPLTGEEKTGRKFVEAEFSLEIPGQEIPPALTAWVAPTESNADADLDPESPFGMGVYLNRYGGDSQGLALMERAARIARDAGVKWSREDFSWSRIEPRRGEYNWAFYDNLLACAHRNGITVYAIVCYWSPWTKPYTPEGINDYVDYVRALVRRYGSKIKHWEIWNEPNIFFWQGPRDMYAELLIRSYAAIKEIDPEAQVLGLSTAGIDNKYIERMLELKAPFDILTIHPYRRELNDLAFIKDLKAVSEQVKLADGGSRPVWLTEMGWATYFPHNTIRQGFVPTSLRAQAELIVRSYLCAIVSGVEPRTFWYNFRNDGEDPVYFEHQMGILYHDFQPKPACIAYANLTRVLKGKKLAGPVPAPRDVLAYAFKSDDSAERIFALWSPFAETQFELAVTSPTVTRINSIGERTTLKPTDGKLTIHLPKSAPVFAVEND